METETTKLQYPTNGQINPRTDVKVWIVVEQNGNERIWLSTPEPVLPLQIV